MAVVAGSPIRERKPKMKVGDQVRLNGVKGRIAEILQGGCKAWVKWCDGLQSAEWCAALEKLNK